MHSGGLSFLTSNYIKIALKSHTEHSRLILVHFIINVCALIVYVHYMFVILAIIINSVLTKY